ncbi:MAG: nitrophenyl compound nitroreductase subunit ArsF family protein [bacterium]
MNCRAAESAPPKKAPATAKAKTVKKKPAKASPKVVEVKKDRKVVAYYFHGAARCVSCKTLEAITAEAINKGFEKELKDGTLEWKVVNVEEKGNEHFIQDYKLYTKSVVLSDMRDGKEKTWKNLDKVWELLRDKDAFQKYITEETRAFMAVK